MVLLKVFGKMREKKRKLSFVEVVGRVSLVIRLRKEMGDKIKTFLAFPRGWLERCSPMLPNTVTDNTHIHKKKKKPRGISEVPHFTASLSHH